jgi:hypothetical protein
MHDACDPATFDAALQDPSACLRDGGVTFQEFVAQLQNISRAMTESKAGIELYQCCIHSWMRTTVRVRGS